MFKYLIVFMFLTMFPFGFAQAQTAGEKIKSLAYCLTEQDAKELSRIVALQGLEGYIEYMSAQGNVCFDSRLTQNPPVTVTLMTKVWSFTRLDGVVFDVWTARDSRGRTGWMWFPVREV